MLRVFSFLASQGRQILCVGCETWSIPSRILTPTFIAATAAYLVRKWRRELLDTVLGAGAAIVISMTDLESDNSMLPTNIVVAFDASVTFDKYGLGQIARLQDGRCRVRFFRSANDYIEHEYDTTRVEGAYLHPQTRAYFCSEDGNWMVGLD